MVGEKILAAFIRENFRTVCALDLLLLLHENPARTWSREELVRELRASVTLIDQALAQFLKIGVAEDDAGAWRLAAIAGEKKEIVQDLVLLYQQRPIATVSLIREADPIQGLADAFKVRRDQDE